MIVDETYENKKSDKTDPNYWQNENAKLKEILKKHYPNRNFEKIRNNAAIKFAPNGELYSAKNSNVFLITEQKVKNNDKYFIERLSDIIDDKVQLTVKIQPENNDRNKSEELAKVHTEKLVNKLEQIYLHLRDDPNANDSLKEEAYTYLNFSIFIKYFIVFKHSLIDLLNIRNDFYKYVYKFDPAQIDLARRNEFMLDENNKYVETTTSKIFLYLRTCDFVSLANTLQSFSEYLMKENSVSALFPGVNRELSSIFDFLHQYFICLNNFVTNPAISLIDNIRDQFHRNTEMLELECNSIISDIKNHIAKNDSDDYLETKNLIEQIERILKIIKGDQEEIRTATENTSEFILMSIYYCFQHRNFMNDLIKNINDENEYLSEREKIMIACIKNDPNEFYMEATEFMPKWLQFHLLDILYDMTLLTKGNGPKSFRDLEYERFMDYLIAYDVDFKYFYNYSNLYSGEIEIYLKYIDVVSTRTSNKLLNYYEKEFKKEKDDNRKQIFSELYLIADSIAKIRKAENILYSFSRLCFDKLFEIQDYKLAVEIILNNICDYQCRIRLDKLFSLILINDYIPNNYQHLLNLNVKNEKIEFLICLINFNNNLQNINHQEQQLDNEILKINIFFDFCFVKNKCPKVMWIWVLKKFQALYKNGINWQKNISFSDFKEVFNNTANERLPISNAMKNFVNANQDDQFFRKNCFLCNKNLSLETIISQQITHCENFLFDLMNDAFNNKDF